MAVKGRGAKTNGSEMYCCRASGKWPFTYKEVQQSGLPMSSGGLVDAITRSSAASASCLSHTSRLSYTLPFPYTERNFQLSNVKDWEKGQQRPSPQKNVKGFFHEGKHILAPPWCWDPNYFWGWETQIWSIPYFICRHWEFVYENPPWKFTLKLQLS